MKVTKVNNYMALMRNLRNIDKAGVSDDHIDKVCSALTHEPAVLNSKQLPFRFYAAYNQLRAANANPLLLEAVESAMELSIANLPKLKGRVASLCDNSGSAHGTMTSAAGTMKVSTIANLQAVLTGMATDGEATVHPFGDRLNTVEINPTKGVFKQLDVVEKSGQTVGGGTETGIWLFWHNAIKNKVHYDQVFVYSDMQAGHGGLFTSPQHKPTGFVWENNSRYGGNNYVDVPALIAAYRKKVNPDVQVYLVQVAGYSDGLVPEIYDKTYILGGWSTGILKFADKVTSINP